MGKRGNWAAIAATFLILAAAIPSYGQVLCKLSIESSFTMKGLYGGKVTVLQGRVTCKNYGTAPVSIGGSEIDLSLPVINTLPASDASALLTRTYKNQPGQRISRDLTTGLGALGVLEAAKVIALPAGPIGLAVAGAVGVIQYVIPSLTTNEPALDLSNQCDSVQGIALAAGATLFCKLYLNKPPKNSPPVPASMEFALANGTVPAGSGAIGGPTSLLPLGASDRARPVTAAAVEEPGYDTALAQRIVAAHLAGIEAKALAEGRADGTARDLPLPSSRGRGVGQIFAARGPGDRTTAANVVGGEYTENYLP